MIVDLQLQVMVMMIGAGSLIGLNLTLYDRYIIREKSSGWRWLTDGAFWIVQAIVVFLLLFQVNGGEWRMYVLLSVVCGFAAYETFIKKIIISIFNVVDNVIKWIVRAIITVFTVMIVSPILLILRVIQTVGGGLFSAVCRILLFILRLIYKPFDPIFQYSRKNFTLFAKKVKKWLNVLYNKG